MEAGSLPMDERQLMGGRPPDDDHNCHNDHDNHNYHNHHDNQDDH